MSIPASSTHVALHEQATHTNDHATLALDGSIVKEDDVDEHPIHTCMTKAEAEAQRIRMQHERDRLAWIEVERGQRRMKRLWGKTRPKENLLLRLPPELRNMIFCAYFGVDRQVRWSVDQSARHEHGPLKAGTEWPDYACKGERTVLIQHWDKKKWPPPMLRVSRQVRAEASAVYFSRNKFFVKCQIHQLNTVVNIINSDKQRWIMSRDESAQRCRFAIHISAWKSTSLDKLVAHLKPVSVWTKENAAIHVVGNPRAYKHIKKAEWPGNRMRTENRDDDWLDEQYREWSKRLTFQRSTKTCYYSLPTLFTPMTHVEDVQLLS